MDARYANSFISSATSTVGMFLNVECKKESVEVLRTLPPGCNMHVFLGLTGDLYGTVILSMTQEASLKLASGMMGGMALPEHNEISYSAIKEILNITSGSSATRLSELGCLVDLTPPTLVVGENVDIQMTFPLISIVFSVLDFTFRMSVSIKEKDQKTVLLVDDSALIRAQAYDLLTSKGFSVVGQCKDGQECLSFLEKQVPSIVLMDVTMPGISGLEVLRHIRERKIDTKVVLFTGTGDPATVQQATALGVDGYVLKPISEMLLIVLRNL